MQRARPANELQKVFGRGPPAVNTTPGKLSRIICFSEFSMHERLPELQMCYVYVGATPRQGHTIVRSRVMLLACILTRAQTWTCRFVSWLRWHTYTSACMRSVIGALSVSTNRTDVNHPSPEDRA